MIMRPVRLRTGLCLSPPACGRPEHQRILAPAIKGSELMRLGRRKDTFIFLYFYTWNDCQRAARSVM